MVPTCECRRALAVFGVMAFLALPAFGQGFSPPDGRWRIELQGADVFHSDKADREGNYFVTGSAEYEMPIRMHLTLGLRAYPLFYYREPESVFGVAGGIDFRWYPTSESQDGFYAEAGTALLWQSRNFPGNSLRVNFLNELGIGYAFPDTPWSVSLKYQHISNAGLGSHNSGVNGLSMGVGYRF